MEKQKETFGEPMLCLVYFYKPDGDNDTCLFVADKQDIKNSLTEQFLNYANNYQDWNIKESDIEDIYIITNEDNFKGQSYNIVLTKK